MVSFDTKAKEYEIKISLLLEGSDYICVDGPDKYVLVDPVNYIFEWKGPEQISYKITIDDLNFGDSEAIIDRRKR